MRFSIVTTLILSLISSACSFFEERPGDSNHSVPPYPETYYDTLNLNLQLDTYKDCAELQNDIRANLIRKEEVRQENLRRQREYYTKFEQQKSMPGNAQSAMSPSTSDDQSDNATEESFTNIQEQGIDEPDFIKIGSKQIFVLRETQLVVSDRTSLAEVGILKLEQPAQKIFYSHGKIVLIGSKHGYLYRHNVGAWSSSYYEDGIAIDNSPQTVVSVYSEQAGKTPKLLKKYEIAANYVDSRLKDGRLILVSNSYLPFKKDYMTWEDQGDQYNRALSFSAEPIELTEDKVRTVPCHKVVKPPVNDEDYSLIVVSTFDLKTDDIEENMNAALGSGDDVYMGQEGLYIAKNSYYGEYWYQDTANQKQQPDYLITKARLTADGGYPVFTARGMISGYTKDQYSFKEYADEDILAVITTSNGSLTQGEYDEFNHDNKGEGRNHLFALKEEAGELHIKKVIKNFGKPGEDIRSVRFEKDRAYAVTFKKTDPLYAFDMTNPAEPAVIGELEIPGFSSYLHSLSADRLIGIGFDAADQGNFAYFQGIQVSLFDVANGEDMARLDNIVLGKRGSSSEVTHDAHAFFIDKERSLFALPVVLLGGQQSYDADYGSELEFSGAIFYRVENDKLVETRRVSHLDFIPEQCRSALDRGQWWQNESISPDINRILDIDDRYLTISRFGIKVVDKSSASQVTKSVSFSNQGFDCAF